MLKSINTKLSRPILESQDSHRRQCLSDRSCCLYITGLKIVGQIPLRVVPNWSREAADSNGTTFRMIWSGCLILDSGHKVHVEFPSRTAGGAGKGIVGRISAINVYWEGLILWYYFVLLAPLIRIVLRSQLLSTISRSWIGIHWGTCRCWVMSREV